jgi:hypothetical protein
MSKRSVIVGLVALMVLSLVVSVVMAADKDKKRAPRERGDRTRVDGGDRSQRGSGGMADFQKRIMGMYKENLGASDVEWKIIEPKLTKVMELSRESRSSGMRGMMGRGVRGGDAARGGRGGDATRGVRGGDAARGGRGGDATRGERTLPPREGDRPESEIQKASTALDTVLENKSATNDQIKAKLLQLRKAKEKAQQVLVAAQKDLKSVLTVRQEAKLVAAGMLN